MTQNSGGCLCGALRYTVSKPPLWVTICTCTFCQRATGAQGMVEPIFEITDLEFTKGTPKQYAHRSSGSGKNVFVHFCETCGTKTHLTFERWPDKLGVYAGTFDRPGWFEISPDNTKYIFRDNAARGTLFPAGFKTYPQHAATAEGVPLDPEVLDEVLHLR